MKDASKGYMNSRRIGGPNEKEIEFDIDFNTDTDEFTNF